MEPITTNAQSTQPEERARLAAAEEATLAVGVGRKSKDVKSIREPKEVWYEGAD